MFPFPKLASNVFKHHYPHSVVGRFPSAGSDDESGTVTLKALSSGATRLDFSLPSGPRSEFRGAGGDYSTGGWSGPDATVHPIASQNLVNDWGWFPLFSLTAAISVITV